MNEQTKTREDMIEIATLWMKERLRFENICIESLLGRLRPKEPFLIQKISFISFHSRVLNQDSGENQK